MAHLRKPLGGTSLRIDKKNRQVAEQLLTNFCTTFTKLFYFGNLLWNFAFTKFTFTNFIHYLILFYEFYFTFTNLTFTKFTLELYF